MTIKKVYLNVLIIMYYNQFIEKTRHLLVWAC